MIRQIYREEFEQSGVDDVRSAIARDAADAAWVSARASQSANRRATIALVISGFSALVAIAAIILPYLTKPYG